MKISISLPNALAADGLKNDFLYFIKQVHFLGSCRAVQSDLGNKCRSAAAAAKSLQSCPTLQPHRRQPTRLPHPWGSPGKNTGVGCHFLLQRMNVKSESEVAQSCLTPSDPMDCSLPGSSAHGIFQARVLEWGVIAFSKLQIYLMVNRSFLFRVLNKVSLEQPTATQCPPKEAVFERDHPGPKDYLRDI